MIGIIILIVIMLISAVLFSQSLPPTPPEWNPMEQFFQGYLKWTLAQSFVFCFGFIFIAFLVVSVWGKLAGYTKRVDKELDEMTSEEIEQNCLADKAEGLNYMMKNIVIFVPVLMVIAAIIGLLTEYNP